MGFWGSISGIEERPQHQMEQRGIHAACLVFISSLQSSVIDFPRHQAFPSLTKWRHAGRGGTDTGGIHPLRPCKREWLLTFSRWGLRGLESVFVLFCLLFIFWDKVPPCNSGWLWVAAILLPHPTNCCDCRCERPCLTFWQLLSSAPPGHASRNRWRLKLMYGPFQVWGLPPLNQGCPSTWPPACLLQWASFGTSGEWIDLASGIFFFGGLEDWSASENSQNCREQNYLTQRRGKMSLKATVRKFVRLSRTPWTQGAIEKMEQIGGFTLTDRKQTFPCLLRGDCVSSGFSRAGMLYFGKMKLTKPWRNSNSKS